VGPRRPSARGFTLVLGGGGSVGLAYMCGALRALADVTGLEPKHADLMIGTSAGSVMATELRLGRSVAEVLEAVHPDFEERATIVRAWESLPDLARRLIGSSWVVGRSMVPISIPTPHPPAFIQRIFPGALLAVGGERPWHEMYPPEWPDQPLWITAVDLDSKRRVVLDRHGRRPESTLQQAVRASCAVPGVYSPIRVGGLRLVDGGVASVTNLDLAAACDSHVVIALAPMAFDPRNPPGYLQAAIRNRFNQQLRREGDRVRRAGKRLLILRPTGFELEHHGLNFLSNKRNDVVESVAYDSTVATLSTDRVRVLLDPDA
jgi:NTE family protein